MQNLAEKEKPSLESEQQVSGSSSLVVSGDDSHERPHQEAESSDLDQPLNIPVKIKLLQPLKLAEAPAVPGLSDISEVEDYFEAEGKSQESQHAPASTQLKHAERLDAIRDRVRATMAQI